MTSLSDSIRFLHNAAPEEFEQFCQAFARYSDEVRDRLVKSPGQLEVLQGHAQQCVKILELLNGGERAREHDRSR
jgi:hypothetical protein